MTKLTKRQEEMFKFAAEAVCEAALPMVRSIAEATDRAALAVMASLFRPFLREIIDPEPHTVEADKDLRVREWQATAYFWDIEQGTERADLLAETDTETLSGLSAIIELLQEHLVSLHGDLVSFPEFHTVQLRRRIKMLRPAIYRGNGSARMRIYYTTMDQKRMLCQVDVKRVEEAS